MTYNSETVKSLLSIYAGDGEMIEIILDALDSFEKYHQAIYTLELRRELHIRGAMDDETYREEIPRLDQIRTTRHCNKQRQNAEQDGRTEWSEALL